MKKRKINLLTLLISILLSILLAEIILRVHYTLTYGRTLEDAYKIKTVNRPYYTLGYLIRPSPYWKIVYELRPDLNVSFMGKKLVTNSEGWREKEFSKKTNDTSRIVGIGDSYMFGWSVDVQDRYMDMLGNDLNGMNENPGMKFETYALAVPGYNFVMEEEALERYGMDLQPDIVIYDFVNNDFCLPNFIAPVRNFWSKESFILLYINKALGKGFDFYNTDDRGNLINDICTPDKAPKPYDQLVGKENFEKALERYQGLSGRTKVAMLVSIPTIFDSNATEWLDSLPGRYPNITFIYLNESTDYLNAENMTFYNSDLILGNGDYHFSKKGNMLVAQWLEEELVNRGLVTKV